MTCATQNCNQHPANGSLDLYCPRCMEEILALKIREPHECRRSLLIIGHGRHGKDTLAEIWDKHYGLRYTASSMMCARIFIFDALKDKYGYETLEECFEDRVNHRDEWKKMICDYNTPDKSKLSKEILRTNDCYVGLRDREEVDAAKAANLFKLIIWVDASERLPPEPTCGVTKDDADVIIDNNCTLEEFEDRAVRLGRFVFSILRK